MHEGERGRRRCAECRCYYEAAASAARSQRVCGPACRKARQRKLARARRALAVDDYRVDERLRQQKSRAARKGGSCHAPPSAPKYADIKRKLLDSWDTAAAASRASLERRLPGIVRALLRPDGTAQATDAALSRATLPSQAAGSAGERG